MIPVRNVINAAINKDTDLVIRLALEDNFKYEEENNGTNITNSYMLKRKLHKIAQKTNNIKLKQWLTSVYDVNHCGLFGWYNL